MILKALTDYYELMAAKGEMPSMGWGRQKVSYALELDSDGNLIKIHDLKIQKIVGKKMHMVPQEMLLPSAVKRSSGVAANFLWDNSSYMLGIDDKGKPEKTVERFKACAELHVRLLDDCKNEAVQSVLKFFKKWNPEYAKEYPVVAEFADELISGANLVFYHSGMYIHENKDVREKWNKVVVENEEGEWGRCLVTGDSTLIERLHPSIKGIRGGQATGGSIVSFNSPAFCSFGMDQGMNAPVGKYASFAYTTALNCLLSDKDHVYHFADTTIVMWPQNGEKACQDLIKILLMGEESETYKWDDIRALMGHLIKGEDVDFEEQRISSEEPFYILGLAPNSARISVRFFYQSDFGKLVYNVKKHYDAIDICDDGLHHKLSLYYLLAATVRPTSTDKSSSPRMTGEYLRSIIEGKPYPASLLSEVTMRIRSERVVSRERAALIKAYYIRCINVRIPKEVLTVGLNTESEYVPYLLGRLFAVLEGIQGAANPGLNTTIKDKYFSSASSTPAVVFPTLINLSQKHLSKLNESRRIFYSKLVSEIMMKMGETFPAKLTLPEQGAFQLGYYHQTSERYKNKEVKEEEV